MIASENYTSPAVMAAQGSVLTNKYAEGYPGRRYYGGCEFVDVAERLAIERVLKLFGGGQGQRAAALRGAGQHGRLPRLPRAGRHHPGLDLAHGGHLTHGMKLNFSGKYFKVVRYGVTRETERIDFDQVARLAREHKPKLVVAGASAYPREIDFGQFAEICSEVEALLMVDMAHVAGLVAAGQHGSPVPVADFVTSTTHKTLRGPRGGFILCKNDWGQKINSAVFPGMQGGPLMHVIAAKAVAFGEALKPEFRTYAAQTIANARTLADELQRLGFRIVSGGTDNHLLLVDVVSRGADRQAGRAGARQGRHHGQQEHDPLRHAAAARSVGHPHRHPGLDDARHARAGDADNRRLDRRSPGKPGGYLRARAGPRAGARAVPAIPGPDDCVDSQCRNRRGIGKLCVPSPIVNAGKVRQ